MPQFPKVWLVYRPHQDDVFLPYPGGERTGSKEVARRVASSNAILGWIPIEADVVPVDVGYLKENLALPTGLCPVEGAHEQHRVAGSWGGHYWCIGRPADGQ